MWIQVGRIPREYFKVLLSFFLIHGVTLLALLLCGVDLRFGGYHASYFHYLGWIEAVWWGGSGLAFINLYYVFGQIIHLEGVMFVLSMIVIPALTLLVFLPFIARFWVNRKLLVFSVLFCWQFVVGVGGALSMANALKGIPPS